MTSNMGLLQQALGGDLSQPLEELPELVARGKISVDVSVSELSERLLQSVREADTLDLQVTGEVLVALTRLMVLKSAQLLVQPVEDDDKDLPEISAESTRTRAAIADRAGWLRSREGLEAFPSAPIQHSIKRPVAPRSPLALARVWSEMRGRQTEQVRTLPVPTFVRLEVAVSRLLRGLRSRGRVSLGRIVARASRKEAVMYFLGVLELHRRRRISVAQEELFADIQLEPRTTETHADARAG
jgi:chromatin segregation and condensation protein Rec8/ScpA/Scc1 (kleisin family)